MKSDTLFGRGLASHKEQISLLIKLLLLDMKMHRN